MKFQVAGRADGVSDEDVHNGWSEALDLLAEPGPSGGALMGPLPVEQINSVDGYAAGPNGDIAFMTAVDQVDPNDTDQREFLKGVDAILLGATTYWRFAEYRPKAGFHLRGLVRADRPAAQVRRVEHA